MWVPAIQVHLGHLNIRLVSLGMFYGCFFFLLPTASAAISFRSVCGSKRGPPENNRQRRPVGTPHVGQGTELLCFLVSSPIFMPVRLPEAQPQSCSLRNTLNGRAAGQLLKCAPEGNDARLLGPRVSGKGEKQHEEMVRTSRQDVKARLDVLC